MSSGLKSIFVIAVIGVASFFGYRYFFVNESTPSLKIEGASVNGNSKAGQDFLAALINLQHVNLDTAPSVLSDQAFILLKDASFALPDEPRGRPNPFRPIGNDESSFSPSSGQPQSGGVPGNTATTTSPKKAL